MWKNAIVFTVLYKYGIPFLLGKNNLYVHLVSGYSEYQKERMSKDSTKQMQYLDLDVTV